MRIILGMAVTAVIGISLFAASIASANSTHPVKGIDVIVKKNPGNTAARSVKTDPQGVAGFGRLEKGQYSLTIVAPKAASSATNKKAAGETQFTVALQGVKGNSQFQISAAATQRSRPISFETEGSADVKVTVSAE